MKKADSELVLTALSSVPWKALLSLPLLNGYQSLFHWRLYPTAASDNRSWLGVKLDMFYLQSRHQYPNHQKMHFVVLCSNSSDSVRRATLGVRFLIPGKPRWHEGTFLHTPALLCVCLSALSSSAALQSAWDWLNTGLPAPHCGPLTDNRNIEPRYFLSLWEVH